MSRIYLEALPNNILAVRLDTESRAVNTFSARLDLTNGTVKKYDYSNSIVNLWIEKPDESNGQLSAMIPGGYDGSNGELFRMELNSDSSGEVKVMISEQKFFLHDTQATEISASSTELMVKVQSYPQGVEYILLILVIIVSGVIYFKKKF